MAGAGSLCLHGPKCDQVSFREVRSVRTRGRRVRKLTDLLLGARPHGNKFMTPNIIGEGHRGAAGRTFPGGSRTDIAVFLNSRCPPSCCRAGTEGSWIADGTATSPSSRRAASSGEAPSQACLTPWKALGHRRNRLQQRRPRISRLPKPPPELIAPASTKAFMAVLVVRP